LIVIEKVNMMNGNKYGFPPTEELKEMREKPGIVNIVLPEKASFSEQIKYEISQAILNYQQEKELSYEKLAEKIGTSLEQTLEILRGNITIFPLDSLISYAEKLPLQVKITKIDAEQSNIKTINQY
jgi:predicted XRE-type DNA-binding protein